MTDHERGTGAADKASDAFVFEVWWCEVHETSSKRSGFCVMYSYLIADAAPVDLGECVMVKARLVVSS
jgi:hypothetical protein